MKEKSCSYLIRHIAHTITCMQDKCLNHYGLTNQQARLLQEVTELSKHKKVFGRKDLAKSLNLKGSSVTSLLHGLEKKELIKVESSSKDARRKVLNPTEEGKKLIKDLNLIFTATENQLTDRLTDEELEKFNEYLQVAYENMVV